MPQNHFAHVSVLHLVVRQTMRAIDAVHAIGAMDAIGATDAIGAFGCRNGIGGMSAPIEPPFETKGNLP